MITGQEMFALLAGLHRAQAPMPDDVTTVPVEIFGVQTDMKMTHMREGDTIKITFEYVMPRMQWDAERGVMRVIGPPKD